MTGLKTRRDVLALGGAALIAGHMPLLAKPTGWQTMSPSDAGFVADLNGLFDAILAAGRLSNLHGVVALHGGRIFFERYLRGIDYHGGESLGEVSFEPDMPHDMRSVTKSVVGLLYGVALAGKRVPAPDQPLLAQFPEYPDLAKDPARARLTVANALTMTLGTEWNESGVPYTDPANGETAMNSAPDRYRFVLDRPVIAPPGQVWMYNGGAVALVGKLIEKGTGQALPDFARSALFEPLGIDSTEWRRAKDGEANAASGLSLTPRDLARIGQMVLSDGKWNNRVVVPAEWLRASFKPAAMVFPGEDYGYLWRVGEIGMRFRNGMRGHHYVLAWGNGGQCLAVFPDIGVVVAITAGNYNQRDDRRMPDTLLREVFLSGLSA